MSYAMLLIKDDAVRDDMSDVEKDFDALLDWWADLRDRGVIVGGAELAPPRSAQTVAWSDGRPIVSDGPHLEAKETVGGIAILAVGSQEEAVEIASSWPSRRGMRIEVRRIVRE